MIDSNTNISITLNAQQWNIILMTLAEGPYRVVAPLIADIQKQCYQYEFPAPEAMEQRPTNGEAPHE
jgi:hypothetical protein